MAMLKATALDSAPCLWTLVFLRVSYFSDLRSPPCWIQKIVNKNGTFLPCLLEVLWRGWALRKLDSWKEWSAINLEQLSKNHSSLSFFFLSHCPLLWWRGRESQGSPCKVSGDRPLLNLWHRTHWWCVERKEEKKPQSGQGGIEPKRL